MPVAIRAAFILTMLSCGACQKQSADTTNAQVAANGPTDVITLPPDESDATPTNELENGVDQPADNGIDLNSD